MYHPFSSRPSPQHYIAFDGLWLNGRDLRQLPLTERKQILRSVVPPQPAPMLYVNYIRETGCDLFRTVCERDMEGIVAKLADGIYDPNAPTW